MLLRSTHGRGCWLLLLAALLGCDATEGKLLTYADVPDAGEPAPDASAPTPTPKPTAAVKPGMSLQYQITGDLDTSVDAQLFIVDAADTETREVTALHAAGRLVMAYMSVGSREKWRDDADCFPDAAVGNTLSAYPDEAWLDPRNATVRRCIETRIERADAKGFDGVFASTLGAYRATSGFPLTRADELEYTLYLATAAHTRGLSIGLSGDFELGAPLAEAYDWALANACVARGSCADLKLFSARGLATFDLETEGDHATVCRQAAADGVSVTFKRAAYDAYRVACP
jgi:GNAT superfamily N-acetyltransferase